MQVSFFLVYTLTCLIPLALFYNERIVTECCCGFGKGLILVVGRVVKTRKKSGFIFEKFTITTNLIQNIPHVFLPKMLVGKLSINMFLFFLSEI